MALKRRPVARDVFFYSLSLLVLYYIIEKGRADFTDAVGMLVLYAVYLTLTATAPNLRRCYRTRCLGKAASSSPMERAAADGDGLGEALAKEEGSPDGDDDDDDDEGPAPWYWLPFAPLAALMGKTCPSCEIGSDTEHLYGVTMVVAFGWLALFSTALSAAITRWGILLSIPGTAMAMFIIAVGAQIPDTIQAIAVAKRGFGSMAVASAIGSQVMNILIGLGLPWTISTCYGMPIVVPDEPELATMVYLEVVCVLTYVVVVMAPTVFTWGRFGGPPSIGRRATCSSPRMPSSPQPTWPGLFSSRAGRPSTTGRTDSFERESTGRPLEGHSATRHGTGRGAHTVDALPAWRASHAPPAVAGVRSVVLAPFVTTIL